MLECGLYYGVSDMVLNGHIKGIHLKLLKKWFDNKKINFEVCFDINTYGLDLLIFSSICAFLGNFIVFCRSGDYVFGGFASKLLEGESLCWKVNHFKIRMPSYSHSLTKLRSYISKVLLINQSYTTKINVLLPLD